MSGDPAGAALRSARLRAQLLTSDAARPAPHDVVAHLIGIQAQIPSAAALAIRARTANARAADVDLDLGSGGRLVRTWLMRGTLHLAAVGDVGWLLSALAPTVLKASRRRHTELGLDSATLTRSADVLVRLLADGPSTRSELFAGLAGRGIDPAGQRGIHMIRHAALRGQLHYGPDRGREQTWCLFQRPPIEVDREAALAEVCRRYRHGYGPADVHDLATWSGLTVSVARQAWWLAGEVKDEPKHRGTPRPTVRLLPHFDPYLLGYARRDHAVSAGYLRTVWTGGGYVLPTVTVDGCAVATWRSETKRGQIAIVVLPFDRRRLSRRVSAAIDAEVADIGRFLDQRASWAADVT